jgi:hypothetical protein
MEETQTMATTTDPREQFAAGRNRTRGPLRHWEQWCDGQVHRLRFGEDLPDDVLPSSLQSSLRQWATRRGYNPKRVHTGLQGATHLVVYVEPGALLEPEARRQAVKAGRAAGYPAADLAEETR